MAHFAVAVFTRKMSTNEIIDLMRPYYYDGKYDRYDVGGRWDKKLLDKDGNACNSVKAKDMPGPYFVPYAYVRADGIWDDRPDEPVEYVEMFEERFNEYLKLAQKNDYYITILDCHK